MIIFSLNFKILAFNFLWLWKKDYVSASEWWCLENNTLNISKSMPFNLAEVNHRLPFHTSGFTFSSEFPFPRHPSYCWLGLPLDSYWGRPWMQMSSFTNPVAVTWNTFSLWCFLITYIFFSCRFLCCSHLFHPALSVSYRICMIHLRPCNTD